MEPRLNRAQYNILRMARWRNKMVVGVAIKRWLSWKDSSKYWYSRVHPVRVPKIWTPVLRRCGKVRWVFLFSIYSRTREQPISVAGGGTTTMFGMDCGRQADWLHCFRFSDFPRIVEWWGSKCRLWVRKLAKKNFAPQIFRGHLWTPP